MTTNFKGAGYSAQITRYQNGFMLTVRDRKGRIFRRRRHGTYKDATNEMWRYSDKWRVA